MAELMFVNPSRRGSKKRRAHQKPRRVSSRRRVRRNPVAARSQTPAPKRRYRRNPIRRRGIMSLATDSIANGATGAVGATLTDIVYGMVPGMAGLEGGLGAPAAKAITGIATGALVSSFFPRGRRWGKAIADGAVTVQLHNLFTDMLAGSSMGGVPGGAQLLGRSSTYNASLLGKYMSNGFNQNSATGMGAYMQPAPVMSETQFGAYMRR